MKNLSTSFQAICAVCLFILLGAALIPYAGVQNDEALFGLPLYLFNPKELCISLFHHCVALMVMSYVGTLKTLLYLPILTVFGGNVWSVRLPMVLAGAITVYFFHGLTLRSAGSRPALLGAFLLATDPTFLLTDTFDWGPVALEHFMLVTGCFCLVRFHQCNRMRDLPLGFFFLGLALWNKAVFFWALSGLFVAAVTVFWPEVRRRLTAANAIKAAGAFLVGALPFVIYNVRHPNATLNATAHVDISSFAPKLSMARGAINGSGLFGYIPMPNWADIPKPASSIRGRAAVWISRHFGEHRKNWLEYGLVLALFAAPWWWRSRAARFSLVFMGVTWMLMAMTNGAGGAIHHSVLLWPFPQFFVAIALSSAPWPKLAALAGAALMVMNLLVVNQYVVDLEQDGAANIFTDALFPLSKAFADPVDPQVEQPIYVIDWGMANTLALFHRGRLLVRPADGPFETDTPSEREREIIHIMLSDRNALFLGHVPGREIFTGVRERVEKAAAAEGYRKELLRTISDSNGRPVFEIFCFR